MTTQDPRNTFPYVTPRRLNAMVSNPRFSSPYDSLDSDFGGISPPSNCTIKKALLSLDRKRPRLPLLDLSRLCTMPDFEDFEEEAQYRVEQYDEAMYDIMDHLERVMIRDLGVKKNINEATFSELEEILKITIPIPDSCSFGAVGLCLDQDFMDYLKKHIPAKVCDAITNWAIAPWDYEKMVEKNRYLKGLKF